MIWAEDHEVKTELFLSNFHIGAGSSLEGFVTTFDGGNQIAVLDCAVTFTEDGVVDEDGIFTYHRNISKTGKLDGIDNLTCWFIGIDGDNYAADFKLASYEDAIIVTLGSIELQRDDDERDDDYADDYDW